MPRRNRRGVEQRSYPEASSLVPSHPRPSKPFLSSPARIFFGLVFAIFVCLSTLYIFRFGYAEQTLQQKWKEAEEWRRKIVVELYSDVTDEELDEAARWISYAHPFDDQRSCSHKPHMLNDEIKSVVLQGIGWFKDMKQRGRVNDSQLHQSLLVHATYHSNAIEGNTLSLLETSLVIAGERLSSSPALPDEYLSVSAGKDINETKNHAQTLRYLGLLNPGGPVPIVAGDNIPWRQILKDINSCILKDILILGQNNAGGQWRQYPAAVGIQKVLLPQPDEIPKLMELFETWLNEKLKYVNNDLEAVQLACDAHLTLVHIHPFPDGNGRTARILDALILGKFGLPLPIFDISNREQYMDAISKAVQSWDMKLLCDLHARAILKTIDLIMYNLR